MNCSEFIHRFSEFYDAPLGAAIRLEAEAHLEECENCARYRDVVSRGVILLQSLPAVELPESFRPRLQHRLFHLADPHAVAGGASGSAVPFVTALGMALLLTVIAWSPTIGDSLPEVELPPIVVSAPPERGHLFPTDALGFPPLGSPLDFRGGLWSDPNSLLYEYSPMSERYRTNSVLRRAGLD